MRYYVAGDVLPPSSAISIHTDYIKPYYKDVVGRGSEQYLLGRLSTIA
jgi:hypothetical protein